MENDQLPFYSLILQRVINALGVAPANFAREIGFARPDNLYKILKGKTAPGWGTLIKLATRYRNVNAEFLLRGEGDVLKEFKTEQSQNPQAQLRQEALLDINGVDKAELNPTTVLMAVIEQKDVIIELLKTENEFLKTLIPKPPQPTTHQD